MLTTTLNHCDTFYYVLKCHHGDGTITFPVFAYEFHTGDDDEKTSYYNVYHMFNTKEEAEIFAKNWKTEFYTKIAGKTYFIFSENIELNNFIRSYTTFEPAETIESADYIFVCDKQTDLITIINLFPDKIIVPVRTNMWNSVISHLHNLELKPAFRCGDFGICIDSIKFKNTIEKLIANVYLDNKLFLQEIELDNCEIKPNVNAAIRVHPYEFITTNKLLKTLYSIDGKLKIVITSGNGTLLLDNGKTFDIGKSTIFECVIDKNTKIKLIGYTNFFKNKKYKNNGFKGV